MTTGIAISEDQIVEIMADISNGSTLKQCCERSGVHYGNIVERIHASTRLTELYARVREEFAHYQVLKMYDIADQEEDVARARLKIDVTKWYSAKVLPKFYGEKVTNEVTGADGGPVIVERIVRKIIDPRD